MLVLGIFLFGDVFVMFFNKWKYRWYGISSGGGDRFVVYGVFNWGFSVFSRVFGGNFEIVYWFYFKDIWKFL